MARASTRTILSLDRYAKIMGIDPVMFNGGYQIELASGRILFPVSNSENDIWPQYAWQNSDQISREELAQQIANAEQDIISLLGYFPSPNWITDEGHDMQRHYRPELHGYHLHYDVGGQDYQIHPAMAKFISGGVRKSDLIERSLSVTYLDNDADGYKETATVTVGIDPLVITDPSEVKVYFAGRGGDRAYEIRDFKSKVYNPITYAVVFTFNSWMMVDPELWEMFPSNDNDSKYIAVDDVTNLVTVVDAYREYNDTTQAHVVFYDHDRSSGGVTQTTGFLNMEYDDRFISPIPGTYNSSTLAWERDGTLCNEATHMRINYYSGLRNRTNRPQYSDDYLNDNIAQAIAYLASARLGKVFYANNNATALVSSLQFDMSIIEEGMTVRTPFDVYTNPLGTKRGEWLAWKKIFSFIERVKGGTIL